MKAGEMVSKTLAGHLGAVRYNASLFDLDTSYPSLFLFRLEFQCYRYPP
jgi:hypothetical protein